MRAAGSRSGLTCRWKIGPHGVVASRMDRRSRFGFLSMVDLGEMGELVHCTDQAAVGLDGEPVFERVGAFGLDQSQGDSVRRQDFGERDP